jgi:hypothetical protein
MKRLIQSKKILALFFLKNFFIIFDKGIKQVYDPLS